MLGAPDTSALLPGPSAALLSANLASVQGKPEKIRQTAEEFESVFLSEMLNHMFGDMQEDTLMGDKETDEIYRSMMVQEYGKIISRSGGIGVAEYVAREMLKLQEAKP